MTIEPILIVHGVANHDLGPFHEQVARLQPLLGADKMLIPVDWGPLGGQSTDLADCLPAYSQGQWHVRSEDEATPAMNPELVRAMVGAATLDNARRAQLVSDQVPAQSTVRGTPGGDAQLRVRDAVAGELASTQVLQHIDDGQTLAIVGRAIAAVLQDLPTADTAPVLNSPYAVRGDIDTRGLLDPVSQIAGHVLHGIDDALGRMMGKQLGQLNQSVRERLAEPISGTLGDIMAYQRQPGRIHAVLRDTLARHAPGYGTKDQPIRVLAHSLGGVIAFDAAVNPPTEEQRLWIKSFITFGSQSAFFHIIDPRVPALQPYRHGVPVVLPPSIAQWTNLWDAMDLLAFTAGTVFRLSDGRQPLDICVQDTASELIAQKAWAHSIYWKSNQLIDAIKASFNGAA